MSQFSLTKCSFEEWKKRVNLIVERRIGLSVDDLPDAPFADWFEDGMTPSSAATRVIQIAKE